MVFSDYWFHSHDRRESRVVATTASSLKIRNQIGCSFLYRREVFETIGPYDPAMLGAEDWDYWLRVAARFPMAHLPSPPAYHYIHGLPGSMTVDLSPRLRSLARAIQARYADMRFCGTRTAEGEIR
jgi:hypothetical protein